MLQRPHHSIGASEVHVWHVLADELTNQESLMAIFAVLTPDEQDRMARLRYDSDRRLFLLSRGLIRSVLASYLGCRARDVRFASNNFGKPILDGASDVHFNLTHSRGAAAVAVSRGRQVGIDIEQREREVEFLALAQRFFAPTEADHLCKLPDTHRSEAFFAIWTLKEAFVKGIGRGLTFPLDAFCFDLDGPRMLAFHPLDASVSPDWRFHQFDLGELHCGAVAVEDGAGVEIAMKDWRSVFLV
ncbi:MAG: 4'-phosphopantetheinyl transferase superfamily protein [Planctomycetes bacterium]|nr:4'-phosphopantetheinyl transferase superfamily protein [Planctomycetota bacterium]